MNVSLTNEVCETCTITTSCSQCCSSISIISLTGTYKGPVTFTLDSRKFEYVDVPLKPVGKSTLTAKSLNATEGSTKASLLSGEPPAAAAGEVEVAGKVSTQNSAAE